MSISELVLSVTLVTEIGRKSSTVDQGITFEIPAHWIKFPNIGKSS